MMQYFFNRMIHFNGVGFNGSNDCFLPIRFPTDSGWDVEYDATFPWSVDGQFTYINVYIVDQRGDTTLQNPYPAPSNITYAIRIAGVDTAMSCVIPTGLSLGMSSASPVSITPGQKLTIRRTGPNFPQYCEAYVQIGFSSTNAGESGYGSRGGSWGSGTNRIGGANYYYMPLTHGYWNLGSSSPKPGGATATNSNMYCINAINGNLTRYDVYLQGTPEPAQSFTFTVIKDGIAQDGSGGTVDTRVTISSGDISGFKEFTLPILSTTCLSLQVLGTAGTGFNVARVGCRIKATTDGQFQIPGRDGAIGTTVTVGINSGYAVEGFNFPRQWQESDTATQPGANFRIVGAALWLGDSPGSGKNWSVNLRSNFANAGPVATCSGTNFRAFGTGSATIASTNFLDVQTSSTLSSNNPDFSWNFLISPPAPASGLGGIYYIKPNKTNDTVYTAMTGGTGNTAPSYSTAVVAIPNPFFLV